MIVSRYLILCGAGADDQVAVAQRACAAGLAVWRDGPGLLIAVAPTLPILALGDGGAIFGSVFTPGRPGAVTSLRTDSAASIVSSRGAHLISAYWGHYLALFYAPDGVSVLRPPFGNLPCFAVRTEHGVVLASDVALAETLGLYRRSLDGPGLTRHLLAGDIRGNETCLAGVSELRGGDRLNVRGAAIARETLWTPWRFALPKLAIMDQAEGDRRLRDQIYYSATTATAAFKRPLVLISGGLDSSILAACLAQAGREFVCLTIATANPAGDERGYARQAARAVARPLVERFYDPAVIDLTVSAAGALSRPVARSFEQAANRLALAVADESGCDAILDGGGGDNVFASLQSATPAADCLLDRAGRSHFKRVAGDIALLAQSSRWQVQLRAWQRSRRGTGYRWPVDLRFLTADATADAGAPFHPWLNAPRDVLPGRAAHVAILIAAQGLVEDGDLGHRLPTRSPLVAQPLIETALRIPSWHWFEHGNNRAAARRAFADDLPAAIAWRRSKGTPDSVLVELFERHRALIRNHLVDGVLASHKIVDPVAVAAALDDPRPPSDHGFVRVMQLMDAEVWARAQG